MRYFFRRRIPHSDRALIVESGSRELVEGILPKLHAYFGDRLEVDLVTCYAGLPKGFRMEGRVFRVADYQGPAGRGRLYKELGGRRYGVLCILCSAEPVMTKWKWMLAARIPAKLLVLNENGDYFWADYSNWKTIRHFLFFRSGLAEAGAVRTLVRIALFPFTLAYLLLYAAMVHLRRKGFRLRHG